MSEWFENEAFWEGTFPFMFPAERMEAAPEEVEKVLTLAECAGGNALDLCCGPGRHSVELAKRGFRVTGVDRTPFLLNKARKRGKTEGVDIEWIQKDMREFSRPDTFDVATSLFTSFGYFDDKGEDRQVLANIFASLKDGGRLVMEMMGKERLAHIFQPTSSRQLEDGTLLVERREVFDDWTRVRNEWILIKDDRVTTFRLHHTIYSGEGLRTLLTGAGFADIRLFGNLDGDPYGTEATRLVAVACKPT
jgi:SAM-dependent methyltransferase